jgi:hypothetical protein
MPIEVIGDIAQIETFAPAAGIGRKEFKIKELLSQS